VQIGKVREILANADPKLTCNCLDIATVDHGQKVPWSWIELEFLSNRR
jgi:hypothetical protein